MSIFENRLVRYIFSIIIVIGVIYFWLNGDALGYDALGYGALITGLLVLIFANHFYVLWVPARKTNLIPSIVKFRVGKETQMHKIWGIKKAILLTRLIGLFFMVVGIFKLTNILNNNLISSLVLIPLIIIIIVIAYRYPNSK